MIHKWKCGCIGMIIDKEVWLFSHCTADGPDEGKLGIHKAFPTRNDSLLVREYVNLEPPEIRDLFNDLGELISRGYRYQEMIRDLATAFMDVSKRVVG